MRRETPNSVPHLKITGRHDADARPSNSFSASCFDFAYIVRGFTDDVSMSSPSFSP